MEFCGRFAIFSLFERKRIEIYGRYGEIYADRIIDTISRLVDAENLIHQLVAEKNLRSRQKKTSDQDREKRRINSALVSIHVIMV